VHKGFTLLVLIIAVAIVATLDAYFFKAASSFHTPVVQTQPPIVVVSSTTPATTTSASTGSIPMNLVSIPSSAPQEGIEQCGGVIVIRSSVSSEVPNEGFYGGASPTLNIVPGPTSTVIDAVGPLLGSMDSDSVPTELTCTTTGLMLIATITRSAEYDGAVEQNIQWYPIVKIEVKLQQPTAGIQVTWAMRLSNGVVVDHTHPWPYSGQPYPLTVTTTIQNSGH